MCCLYGLVGVDPTVGKLLVRVRRAQFRFLLKDKGLTQDYKHLVEVEEISFSNQRIIKQRG